MSLHGHQVDGGASASGLSPEQLSHDPTQGRGSSAWQRTLEMNRRIMERNAENRRN